MEMIHESDSENKIVFLYKPAYFGESKLERELNSYASERQEDLRRAGITEIYENFWNARNVVKTNIYGAIPSSELSEEQCGFLMRFGWRLAQVDLSRVPEGDWNEDSANAGDEKYIVLREHPGDENLLLMKFHFQPLFPHFG